MEIANNILSIISTIVGLIFTIYQIINYQKPDKINADTIIINKKIMIVKQENKIKLTNDKHIESSNDNFLGGYIMLAAIAYIAFSWIFNKYEQIFIFTSNLCLFVIVCCNFIICFKKNIDIKESIFLAMPTIIYPLFMILNDHYFIKVNLSLSYRNILKDKGFIEFFATIFGNIIYPDAQIHQFIPYFFICMLSTLTIIGLCICSLYKLFSLIKYGDIVKGKMYNYLPLLYIVPIIIYAFNYPLQLYSSIVYNR